MLGWMDRLDEGPSKLVIEVLLIVVINMQSWRGGRGPNKAVVLKMIIHIVFCYLAITCNYYEPFVSQ